VGVLSNVVSIVGEAAIALNVVPSYTSVVLFPPQATNRRLVEASIVHALWLVQIRNRLQALAGFQIDDLERSMTSSVLLATAATKSRCPLRSTLA
jgi:hypothetical protein